MPTWIASGPGSDWQMAMASRICSLVEPLLAVDELALHLSDQRHRSSEAETAQPQEVAHEFAYPAGLGCRCRRHPSLPVFSFLCLRLVERRRTQALRVGVPNAGNAKRLIIGVLLMASPCWLANCGVRSSRPDTSGRTRRRATFPRSTVRGRRRTCAIGQAKRPADPAPPGKGRAALYRPRAPWWRAAPAAALTGRTPCTMTSKVQSSPRWLQNTFSISKGAASKRCATASTSEDATKRKTAVGSMKRRISHGQAMRSIFGRDLVTQTVRPRPSRFGSLSAGTVGNSACVQAR